VAGWPAAALQPSGEQSNARHVKLRKLHHSMKKAITVLQIDQFH